MPLGREIDVGPRDTVLDGAQAPPKEQSPQCSAHVGCDQTAGWIKMRLGTEVGLGPGDIVLDGDPAPLKRAQHPHFSTHVYCGHANNYSS